MCMEFKIERAKQLKEKPVETKLGFGRHFSDHMLVIDYTEGIGWHDGRIIPYGPIEMDSCLHGLTLCPRNIRRVKGLSTY